MGGRKVWVELTLLALLLFVGLGFRVGGLGFLALPLAVHVVLGLFSATVEGPPRLRAERRLSATRAWEGDSVEVEVRVYNEGPRLEMAGLRDGPYPGLELTEGRSELWQGLDPGQEAVLQYKVHVKRGLYALGSLQVLTTDLLGYNWRVHAVPCPGSLAVLPRYERLGGLAIGPRRTLVTHGTARSRRGGVGVEFFGVRDYQPGDELRRLHWKALARRDQPAVIEFEEERAADVAVVLDVREKAYRMFRGEELLDYSVRGAAALAQYFLSQGHRVGLLMYGAYLDWVVPGYGRRHGERLLRELARAQLGTSEAFAELRRLPTQLLPAGSQLALVSPLLPGDEDDLGALVARGYRVMVLIPDPLALEVQEAGQGREAEIAWRIMTLERWATLRRLYTTGVRPLVWDLRYPLAPQAKAAWRRGR